MTKDTFQLLKYSVISSLLVAAWFASTGLSDSLVVKYLIGWVGLAVVVLYFRWLLKNKVGPRESRL
jgi:hypothetical protein